MSSLSKQIESYLKELLLAEEGSVEIQRSLLSELFRCVPSQINYVLSTRFTPAQGYIVETRRGGGGYVRIFTIALEGQQDVTRLINEGIGRAIGEAEGEGFLHYLHSQGYLDSQEISWLSGIFKDRVLSFAKQTETDALRAHLLSHLLANLHYNAKE